MAYAAHEREGGVLRQLFGRARPVQDGAADVGDGEAVTRGDLAHPAAFGDEVGLIPLAFHGDGGDDAMGRRDAPVVVGQEIAADRGVVAVAERDHRLVDEPGMPVAGEIPEMVMRVDYGQAAIVCHGAAPSFSPGVRGGAGLRHVAG